MTIEWPKALGTKYIYIYIEYLYIPHFLQNGIFLGCWEKLIKK